MTHGETVETIWSHSTSLAISSRENGPHACHALLDTHWGGWNWRKVVRLRESFLHSIYFASLTIPLSTGQQLKKNLEKAWKFAKIQRNNMTELTAAINPQVVETWKTMFKAYYSNPSNPNPFEDPVPSRLFLFPFFPRAECC